MSTRKKRRAAVICEWHKKSSLGYVAASLDADRRIAAGERQRLCPKCMRWFWADEYGEPVDAALAAPEAPHE